MTCIVFPGQGSQFIGMAKDFYDNFDIAKTTFEEISDYTNIDLKKIIFDENSDNLNITSFTQISIFAASVCIYRTFEKENSILSSDINFMLGHSLGEYTALACSNKISLKECSHVLKKRGNLMNDAVEPNKTGMVALIGMNSDEVQKIISDNNMKIEIANDNSPIQIVISGSKDELNSNKDIFLSKGIKKYVQLNVSAAFHSKYMFEAQNTLSNEIEKLNFINNNVKIISNYSAEISNDNEIIKNSLVKQMANRVRWTESIKTLEDQKVTKIIEIGPNKILSGLIKRITNSFDIKSINNISDLEFRWS